MKKKLVFGLSAACIAGAFWACGDGEIINADASLEGLATTLVNEGLGEGEIKSALANCVAGAPGYEGCQEEMANPPDIIETSSETPASSASQTPGTSASQVPHSSSSILRQTSSTGPIGQLSSSSQAQTPVSQIVEVSSSSVQPSTGDTNYGTCAPKVSTIELNTSTTWTFSKGAAITNPMDMMSAKLEWTFEGGSIPSYTVTGSTTSEAVTYTTSGDKNASVTITTKNGSGVVQCSPLHVNGQKIEGCECVPTNIQPDVSKGESATWTASGCTSKADIIGYTWKGATADATGLVATAPVTAKGDLVTGVSFTVANDDNSVETISCDDAKAIDATQPDYLFNITGNQINGTIDTVLNEGCMSVRGQWTDQWNSPSFKVLCDGKADDQSVGMTFTMTYDGKTVGTGSGPWGFSNAGGQIGQMKQGEIAFDNICVTFTGASFVKCNISQ